MNAQTPEPDESPATAVETEPVTNDLTQQQGEVWVDDDQGAEPQEDLDGSFDPDEDDVEDEPIDGSGITDEADGSGIVVLHQEGDTVLMGHPGGVRHVGYDPSEVPSPFESPVAPADDATPDGAQ